MDCPSGRTRRTLAGLRLLANFTAMSEAFGQDAGSYLGLSGVGLDALVDLDAGYLNHFEQPELAALQTHLFDLDALRRLFIEHRHGNWCGPGHIGEEIVDEMDSYCYAHDNAYTALGVTSGGPGAGGGIDMWTRAGLQATVEADEALVAGVDSLTDLDAEAQTFRAGVDLIFGARAAVGALLRRLP